MERLKDQDWSNMTNRDIAEVIAHLKPKFRYRMWYHIDRVLFRISRRYRRHCLLHHTTNAPPKTTSTPSQSIPSFISSNEYSSSG